MPEPDELVDCGGRRENCHMLKRRKPAACEGRYLPTSCPLMYVRALRTEVTL